MYSRTAAFFGNLLSFFYLSVLLMLAGAQVIAPRSSGPLALVAIFFPFLFAPALGLLLPALFPRARVLKAGLVAIAGMYLLTWGVGAFAFPKPAAASELTLRVFSWNLLADNVDTASIRRNIIASNAGVVGVQELSELQSEKLLDDAIIAGRYPYQLMRPDGAYAGMGLLSTYPILESGEQLDPSVVWAWLDVEGRQMLVVNAHPFPGHLSTINVRGLSFPTGFDASERDEAIDRVLALIGSIRAPGESLILLGDFNVTEREPAYHLLSDGLVDAHLAAGIGPGASWKTTSPLIWKAGLGVLRIDYQFASKDLRPLKATTDCGYAGSDHCPLTVSYALTQ